MGTTEDDDVRRDQRGRFYGSEACYVRASRQTAEIGNNRGPGYGFRPVRTLPEGWVDAGVDDSGAK